MMSAPAAYRKDLAANGQPFGERDGEWITIASLAASATLDGEGSAEAWKSAIETAIGAFGAAELDRLSHREWGSGWSDFDPLTLASVAMYEARAHQMSALILDSVLRVRREVRDLAYGRALAQRARSRYFAGEHELAGDLYRQIDLLGRRLENIELRARAEQGFMSLAHVRGNHPEMLNRATRLLALAEQTAIPRVRWNARYGAMITAALFRRFDEALGHGWELFKLGQGDEHGEGLALQSLGQLLLEMGDVDAARAAFVAVLSRRAVPERLLATLGSLATTSAFSSAERATLDWAVAEVERCRGANVPPWAYASALLDCAAALRDAGEPGRGRVLCDEALSIARTRDFHALQYRAETMQFDVVSVRPAREPIAPAGSEIVRSVRRLAPRRLPRHVRMATV
jgi:hypothetical protein